MQDFPRLQGLGTTLERGANIAIFVAISNAICKITPFNPSKKA
jgi:hypothetical protein